MQPTKISIASVLKPIRDPRAYFRFAKVLRETNKYEINIIGFSTKKEEYEKDILLTPIFWKERKHISRLWVGWRLLKSLRKFKPKVLIITTFELLPAAVPGKWFFGYKLIFDIQENQSKNLLYNSKRKSLIKVLTAKAIHTLEYLLHPFVDHFFFAEQCYAQEYPYVKNYTILENKYYGIPKPIHPIIFKVNRPISFLISGTLAGVYGTLEGIKWFKMLNSAHPELHLEIIGHVTMPGYLDLIQEEIKSINNVSSTLGLIPVPYEDIMAAYHRSDVVLMPYHQVPSISPKIPSKFFEALALGKVVLFSPNALWEKMVNTYYAGMGVDFNKLEKVERIFQELTSKTWYENEKIPQELLWESDAKVFLNVISQLSQG